MYVPRANHLSLRRDGRKREKQSERHREKVITLFHLLPGFFSQFFAFPHLFYLLITRFRESCTILPRNTLMWISRNLRVEQKKTRYKPANNIQTRFYLHNTSRSSRISNTYRARVQMLRESKSAGPITDSKHSVIGSKKQKLRSFKNYKLYWFFFF